MKSRIAAIAMTAVMAFSFSACSTTDPAPVYPQDSSAAPSPDGADKDTLFANIVRDNTDTFDGASDEQIVETAHAVCDLWATGATFEDQAAAVVKAKIDMYDGGFLIGAATEAYCPEYSDEIEEYTTPQSNA